ncbi:MAG: hypothetical protein WB682_08450 [Candidatus Dormiibacterota bacterium]
MDNPDQPAIDQDQIDSKIRALFRPYEVFEEAKGTSTKEDINPNYFYPKQGLLRLQKLMDEYVAGQGSNYLTNEPTLLRGLELMQFFKEDLDRLAARDRHELLRCWELRDRIWCAEAHLRHILFRKETRWPGYYYRGDYPKLDEENWRCFVNSRYEGSTGEWEMSKVPHHSIVD